MASGAEGPSENIPQGTLPSTGMNPEIHHFSPPYYWCVTTTEKRCKKALTCLQGSPSHRRKPPGTEVCGCRDSPLHRQVTGLILCDSSSAWRCLPSWSRELCPPRKRSRRRRGGRGRTYLGKVAHPPHPACYPREEGRSLSQPGVVSSPLGESPSPPNWLFQGLRALSVCWRSERWGSARVHCLGARKLRGEVFHSPANWNRLLPVPRRVLACACQDASPR